MSIAGSRLSLPERIGEFDDPRVTQLWGIHGVDTLKELGDDAAKGEVVL